MTWARRPAAGALGLLVALLLPATALGAPATDQPSGRSDGVVVDGTAVRAVEDDGAVTARIRLINTGDDAVDLSGTVSQQPWGCSARVVAQVPARSAADAVVAIERRCFPDDSSTLPLDLDGAAGPLPAVTVRAPVSLHHEWWPALVGLVAGLGAALVLFAWVRPSRDPQPAPEAERRARYDAVTGLVGARLASGGHDVAWRPLPDPPHADRWTRTLPGLRAGWSFQGSWVSTVTIATPALVALLSSADVFAAVLGEQPTAAIGVMTVVGLVSAVLVAVAAAVVRLVGPSPDEVTPLGLVAGGMLVVLAAVTQTVTVGLSARDVLDTPAAQAVTLVLTVVVVATICLYACRSLRDLVAEPPADVLPTLPPDAPAAWRGGADWEEALVRQRLLEAYAPWIAPWIASSTPAPDPPLTPLPPTGRTALPDLRAALL